MVENLVEHTKGKLALENRGFDYELEKKLSNHIYRNLYNEDITITYEDTNDESPPPRIDLMDVKLTKYSPFNYLCLPIQKPIAERREYGRSVNHLVFDEML